MGYDEVIRARVEQVIREGVATPMGVRRARLELTHNMFHHLETAASELSDARRLSGAARADDEAKDELGAAFNRTRAGVARRALAKELLAAAVSFYAAVHLAVGPVHALENLTAGLDEEQAAWLAAVLGVGL